MEADFNEKLTDYGILLRRLLVNKTLQVNTIRCFTADKLS